MIRGQVTIALSLSAALLAACQTNPIPRLISRGPAIEGQWAATSGVFVATFEGGRFRSVATDTNAVLTEGTFQKVGEAVHLTWYSPRTKQQERATCTFTSPSAVHCQQVGATGFDLTRTA